MRFPGIHCHCSNSLSGAVSVIIWKHQDRMDRLGYTGNDSDKLLKLYDQVLWADREIKNHYTRWPCFLRETAQAAQMAAASKQLLPITMMPSLLLLAAAHKVKQPYQPISLT